MRAAPRVVGEISAKNPTEMRLIEHNHMIQALAPQGANHPLDVGILPGTPRTGHNLRDTETRDSPTHLLIVRVRSTRSIPSQKDSGVSCSAESTPDEILG